MFMGFRPKAYSTTGPTPEIVVIENAYFRTFQGSLSVVVLDALDSGQRAVEDQSPGS